ncbi:hypothetical protein [Paractinoplanes lichenicola]|uniref:PH domain-containing protein n=1 Tax=Paractinoplanes lichenicola TaxID=2802976 RepID=A0ABS1VT37_9ACTN|nr:hypothetical protein [Actinoplanes lichenicola]MBL7257630.1 hypothetical protein [Actinoplanes lichenicola]
MTYRYRWTALVVPVMLIASVTWIVMAFVIDAAAWWVELLFLLVAIPLLWLWVLTRLIWRMDLTETELRLRAPLARYHIPLGDLSEIGATEGDNMIRVVRRDGRSWSVLSGRGMTDFADAVGRAAPGVEVRTNGWRRFMSRRDR